MLSFSKLVTAKICPCFRVVWGLLWYLGVHSVAAQTVAIPDTAFERQLLQLGIDSDGLLNGQVLQSDILGVRTLDVDSSNINNLDGIQQFTNLDSLDCSHNNLTTLQLQGLDSLSFLDAQHNQLPRLDASHLYSLDKLYCDFNPLIELLINRTPALSLLSCAVTQLDTIDVSNRSQLRNLRCFGGRLTHLYARNCANLRAVYASNNQLEDLRITASPRVSVLSLSHNNLQEIDLSECLHPSYIDLSDNQLSFVRLRGAQNILNRANISIFLENNPDSLVVCNDALTSGPAWNLTFNRLVLFTLDCDPNTLYGVLRDDENLDCLSQAQEALVHHPWLYITSRRDTLYTTGEYDGYYRVELDTGNYQVAVFTGLPYRTICRPFHNLLIQAPNQADTLDFGGVQTTDSCHFLSVHLSAPYLRSTGGGSSYTVTYKNLGSADASNVYIEVDLDPALNFINSTHPVQAQQGTRYTFDLSTVPAGTRGHFHINVVVNPQTNLGAVLCSEAHIYPDTLCSNPWAGPIIRASGDCINDTIQFRLHNVGGPMVSPELYNIFEDQVMIRTVPYSLGRNDTATFTMPARSAGSLYRIEAQQPSGVPLYIGAPIVHNTVVGCRPNPNGTFATGPIAAYYNGQTEPWIDRNCQATISAYDPNDKAAQPEGYGTNHQINRGTPLQYRVRFQNTGNDTAFNVVIMDTLSPHVDVLSFNMGSASHPHTWRILGNGVLEVTFPNIKLVDSITNEPLSHGQFTYTILPRPNLPLGTRIENQAAIYFDYNPPIFTNTTWHTIGENFRPVELYTPEPTSHLPVLVFPQPVQTYTTFKVNAPFKGTLILEVWDSLGRLVTHQEATGTQQLQFWRGDLPAGVYRYQLTCGDQGFHFGKLIVQ